MWVIYTYSVHVHVYVHNYVHVHLQCTPNACQLHCTMYMYMVKTYTLEKDKTKQHKPNPKAVIFRRKMSFLVWDIQCTCTCTTICVTLRGWIINNTATHFMSYRDAALHEVQNHKNQCLMSAFTSQLKDLESHTVHIPAGVPLRRVLNTHIHFNFAAQLPRYHRVLLLF